MKRNLLAVAMLTSSLGLFTGCSSTDHGAYTPIHTTINNREDVARLVLFDKDTQDSVTCPEIQEGRTLEGRLQVTANVRNMLNRRIQVQMQCVFKDAQGFPTGDETPFQNVFLDENAQEGVQFVAMNEKSARYTIRVRQAR
jgi:hypothetical protein